MEGERATSLNHSPEPIISTEGEAHSWQVFGRTISKNSAAFCAQMIVIYIIVIACLVNISLGHRSELWLVLLSTSLGAILPQPKLKIHKDHLAAANVPVMNN